MIIKKGGLYNGTCEPKKNWSQYNLYPGYIFIIFHFISKLKMALHFTLHAAKKKRSGSGVATPGRVLVVALSAHHLLSVYLYFYSPIAAAAGAVGSLPAACLPCFRLGRISEIEKGKPALLCLGLYFVKTLPLVSGPDYILSQKQIANLLLRATTPMLLKSTIVGKLSGVFSSRAGGTLQSSTSPRCTGCTASTPPQHRSARIGRLT